MAVGVEVLNAISGTALEIFSKADQSLEATLNMEYQEKMLYNSEVDLWKITRPLIRLSRTLLPSMELFKVAMVCPQIYDIDIKPYLTRPAALPKLSQMKQRPMRATSRAEPKGFESPMVSDWLTLTDSHDLF